MAPISKSLALAGALFATVGSAVPVKRDEVVVWETVTDVVWTTIDITTTITAGQGPATAPPAVVTFATAVPVPNPPKPQKPQTPEKPEKPQSPTKQAHNSNSPAPAPAPAPKPAPAPAPKAAPAPDAKPAPAPPSNGGGSGGSSGGSGAKSSGYSGSCSAGSHCTGDATYYDTATTSTNPSYCGTTNDGHTEDVLALPVGIMTDSDCGKTVTIKYGGTTTTGTVVDKCMGCDNSSIDLSRHLFGELSGLGAGRLSGVEWWIN